MTDITLLSPASISIPAGHRVVDPVNVQALAENISENGLLSPIEVLDLGDGAYRLIFGAHRLEAAKHLGWTEIPSIVKDLSAFADESAVQLRTISENLARRELSVLDRAVDIATWCEIYRAAHTNIRPGKKSGAELSLLNRLNSLSPDQQEELSEKFALSFSEAAQKTFGISRPNVFLHIKIAAIPEDLREKISLHDLADSYNELRALSTEPAHRQEQIITIILDADNHISTVADAIAVIDRKPLPAKEAKWEKFSSGISKLKASDKYRIFDALETDIRSWLAERDHDQQEVA